jgi:hypothetical protein
VLRVLMHVMVFLAVPLFRPCPCHCPWSPLPPPPTRPPPVAVSDGVLVQVYAPKGVGALFISKAAHVPALVPLMHGAGQEKGKRAGTENVPYVGARGPNTPLSLRKGPCGCAVQRIALPLW